MTYDLSLLDTCPLHAAHTLSPAKALSNAVQLAQAAEASGFLRYWVAEHHQSNEHASSAPEALIGYLLAATDSIRIGSGGVMLQHYSPYKVTEVFNVLATLAPGRVDLGIGKTPGGLPSATAALQMEVADEKRLDFVEKLELIDQLLSGDEIGEGRFAGLAATPRPEIKASPFLLGASAESAELAARLGWQLSYAGHLNNSEEKLQQAFSLYSKATSGGVPQLSLSVVVDQSETKARERAESIFLYKLHFADGASFTLASLDSAEEFARQANRGAYEIEKIRAQLIAGTAHSVHHQLEALQRRYGVREFILALPAASLEQRLYAIESLPHAARQKRAA